MNKLQILKHRILDGWNSVKDRPSGNMKVYYKMINGVEDCGFYHKDTDEFTTIDPKCISPIVLWKQFDL